jgi:hypothetical protein
VKAHSESALMSVCCRWQLYVRQLGELGCEEPQTKALGAPETDLYPMLLVEGSTRHATDIRQNVLPPLISQNDPTRAIASPSRRPTCSSRHDGGLD